MKRKQFADEHIIGIPEEAEAGGAVPELCHKHGTWSATYYARKANFGGLEVSDAKRLRTREHEEARLKRLPTDTMPDNAGLKALQSNKWYARCEAARGRTSPGDVGDARPADVHSHRGGLYERALSLVQSAQTMPVYGHRAAALRAKHRGRQSAKPPYAAPAKTSYLAGC